MQKTSIYDRLSAKREAQAEAARLARLAEPANMPEPAPEPQPLATALLDVASGFTFAGFHLQFPAGFRFRDIQTTLEHEGEAVSLRIRRRDVRPRQTLEALFDEAIKALRELTPQLRLIRQRDCHLAGHPAKVLDFHFTAGHEPRHGRLVGALVPVAGSDLQQWLDISSVIDPSKPGLSQWLADFDRMLDGFAPG
ncbi:DcrB-related protein [Pseudomonas sp. CM25]|uniref:DcrB-related protein n=1 Tax=Pseudomonas sp. CM25 TaxID=2738448 RepID=UPI0015534AEC|nr:DcrB-related protein [Pseudomonas sp. CM25]NQD55122.1 DcrB-related protein [Pseudomonas sp. CM25]HEN8800496.1 DcrB-related protein [Pseudomonas putida]